MENRLDNKAMFLGNYIMQKVLKVSKDAIVTQHLDYRFLTHSYIVNGILELTPLSAISDEDATEVAYLNWKSQRDTKVDLEWIKSLVPTLISNREIADYLRSKSYALPFNDLSVEKLIEFGWVELKKQ